MKNCSLFVALLVTAALTSFGGANPESPRRFRDTQQVKEELRKADIFYANLEAFEDVRNSYVELTVKRRRGRSIDETMLMLISANTFRDRLRNAKYKFENSRKGDNDCFRFIVGMHLYKDAYLRASLTAASSVSNDLEQFMDGSDESKDPEPFVKTREIIAKLKALNESNPPSFFLLSAEVERALESLALPSDWASVEN